MVMPAPQLLPLHLSRVQVCEQSSVGTLTTVTPQFPEQRESQLFAMETALATRRMNPKPLREALVGQEEWAFVSVVSMAGQGSYVLWLRCGIDSWTCGIKRVCCLVSPGRLLWLWPLRQCATLSIRLASLPPIGHRGQEPVRSS